MIISEEQLKSLREAAVPLIKWMNENCNPHMKAIVETNGVELVSGSAFVNVVEFIKD